MEKTTVSTIVNETNTAKAVGSGNLEVFGTPMMIALMEEASAQAMLHLLKEGQASVGTMVNIEHTAPSPLTATITATAIIENIDGRKVDFTVIAEDNAGEIGKGTHTRFIIDSQKLLAKAGDRI